VFGSPEYSTDNMPILDPRSGKVTTFKMPVAQPSMPEALGPGHAASIKPLAPSAYWGEEKLWDTRANNHNAMFDRQGRMWMAATVRGRENPTFCKKGSEHPSAKVFPLESSSRQVAMLDPKTMKYTFVDTCFGTHHLQFSEKQDMLYFSGGGATIPWVNVKTWEATKNEQQSTGWCPTVLDTNGDGKITKPWNEPVGGGRSQEEGGGGGRLGTFDPKLDTRVNAGSYGIIVSPTDDSVWSAGTGYPGRFTRLELGANPPETCKAEI
jgi:hypothetical protein